MWKGNVQRTERPQGRLDIIITYDNGTNSFDETISTDKAQYDTWLSDQIQARLNQLNMLDDFENTVNSSNTVKAVDIKIDPVTSELVQSVPDTSQATISATPPIDTQLQ